jgi:predicted metalloprotease with PDZ domain
MPRFALLVATLPTIALAQSAPISDVRYDVTVDSTTVTHRDIDVSMQFRVGSDAPIVLSLPAWSPGHYVLLWFARRVSHFAPTVDGKPLHWRMVDYQTWRLTGAHTGQHVTVRFSYLADTIDRAVAWTKPDFAFFNGTNLFLYPVGRGFNWPATVTVHTSPGWRIATGMDAAPAPPTYGAANYHDLTDSPFFMIRDASNNARSLDDVMRTLYETTYKKGLGFTPAEWWGTISQYAGGKSFDAVNRRFIEGRDAHPWDSVLSFAGLRITTDTVRDVALGLIPSIDSAGVRALFVIPGGAAEHAGIKVGDIIVSLGDVVLGRSKSFDDALDAVRSELQDKAQAPYVVRRGSETVNGSFPVEFDTHARTRIAPDPNASEKAQRIRHGLFYGSTS